MPNLKRVRWYEINGLSGTPPFQERDEFPALEVLALSKSVMPDLSSPSLHGLTKLEAYQTVAPITQWFNIIQPMKELEELCIVLSISSLIGIDLSEVAEGSIVLPKLTNLNIDDFWGTAVVFFSKLELPPLKNFRGSWLVRALRQRRWPNRSMVLVSR